MALTEARLKELTLSILENARQMVEADGVSFTLTPAGSVAKTVFTAWPTGPEGRNMVLMLAISEQRQDVDDIASQFAAWGDEQHGTGGT